MARRDIKNQDKNERNESKMHGDKKRQKGVYKQWIKSRDGSQRH